VRRARPDLEQDGEVVVRAVVQARLLGLHILSLDARVVVGRSADPVTALCPDPTARSTTQRLASPARAVRQVHDGNAPSTPDLSHAVELLAYVAETLERSRRITDESTARRRVG
jgi:hypothetical protein